MWGIEYILIFLFVYFLYYVFIFRKEEKLKNYQNSTEMKHLINRYRLNMKKLNLKKTVQKIALVNALIITLTLMVVDQFQEIWLKILVGFATVLVLQLLTYHLLGKYLKRGEKK